MEQSDPWKNRPAHVYVIVDPSCPAGAIKANRRREVISGARQGMDILEGGNEIAIDESPRRTEAMHRTCSSSRNGRWLPYCRDATNLPPLGVILGRCEPCAPRKHVHFASRSPQSR